MRSSAVCQLASADDPYLIDMIKLADDRITQLQMDLDETRQAKEILDTKLSNYKNQVSAQIF